MANQAHEGWGRIWIIPAVLCTFFISPVATQGQDLSYAPLSWREFADDAPAPTGRLPLAPSAPKVAENADLYAYRITFFEVRDGAHFQTLQSLSSHSWLPEDSTFDRGVRYKGSSREKLRIGLLSRALLFNPKQASDTSQRTLPRLVLPVAAILPKSETEVQPGTWTNVRIQVAADGTVTALACLDEFNTGTESRALSAAEAFRFLPAMKAGQAVSSEVVVPVVFIAPTQSLYSPKELSKGVIPLVMTRPKHPPGLALRGAEGSVVVKFTIETNGRVGEILVLAATRPEYIDSTFKALRKWKFVPGYKNGRPVRTRVTQRIEYAVRGYVEHEFGNEIVRGRFDILPRYLRYDTPPSVNNTVAPVFPYELLAEGKYQSTKVQVSFVVGSDGRVSHFLNVEGDNPRFFEAAKAAVSAFSFEPARLKGIACSALLATEVSFDSSTRVASDFSDRDLMIWLKRGKAKLASPKELDSPLQVVLRVPTVFPLTCAESIRSGEAVVEAIVDEDGRVRLAEVKSASSPEFGFAAVQSVSQWRFEKPTKNGKPARAHFSERVAFSLDE